MRRASPVAAVAALLVLANASAVRADETERGHDPWAPLRFFVGAWEGTGGGQPGTSRVSREYRLTLGGRFLEVRNRAVYAPQEKNPKGETHEDIGYISWDRSRRRFVLRQFHVEGFVNQYVADSLAAGADSVVFTSEAIENLPPGWRARETLRILGPGAFVERFELAAPGKDFELYSESRLRRRK